MVLGAAAARAPLGPSQASREAGSSALVLETGTAQPEAIELYLSAGYEPVERFGYYAWSPTSRYYGRLL